VPLFLVFTAALGFYWVTLAPTVVWGDSARLTLRVVAKEPLAFGTAGDHPLFVVIGRILVAALPGDPARLVNFEAALFGALAVAVVYRCARQLGTSRLAAAAGAASLAVAHTFWLHAVMAEVYTANAFFLAATLSLLLDWRRRQQRRYLAAAVTVFAIGLTNHLVLAALVPAAVVFVVVNTPRPRVTRRSLWWLGGAGATVAAIAFAAPSAAAAFQRLWFGPPSIWEYFTPTIAPRGMAREAGYYLLYLVYQFPSISLPLGLVGLWTLLRDDARVGALLLLAVAVNAGIFIHHTGWESPGAAKFVFYLADYVVFSILCAIGVHEMLVRLASQSAVDRSRLWGTTILAAVALLPPLIYAILPASATRMGIDLVHARTLPYRDNQRYFLNPNKRGEDGARRFATEALQVVRPGAVIFADFTPASVIRYVQVVDRVRPDVILRYSPSGIVVVEWLFDGGHRRPTYVASLTHGYYDLSGVAGEYDLVPVGPLIEVRPRAGSTASASGRGVP